jgi:hypothetical protein
MGDRTIGRAAFLGVVCDVRHDSAREHHPKWVEEQRGL